MMRNFCYATFGEYVKEMLRAGDIKRRAPIRLVIMTKMDEAIFSAGLREHYPHIGFEDFQGQHDSLVPCGGVVTIVRDRRVDVGAPIYFIGSNWVLDLERRMRGAARRLAFDLPTLSEGQMSMIWFEPEPSEAETPLLHKQAWRLITKICTNRMKCGSALTNELQWGSDHVTMAAAGADLDVMPAWAGHHALEWCAAGGPRRMLDGSARPCDDWKPPTNDWYLRLRREAEERYGPDLGLPPPMPD